MPISYNKLLTVFKEKGVTSYTIKKEKIVGQSAWKKIHENGHIDTRTIEALCKYLNCQPGDILEYIPDEPDHKQNQIRNKPTLLYSARLFLFALDYEEYLTRHFTDTEQNRPTGRTQVIYRQKRKKERTHKYTPHLQNAILFFVHGLSQVYRMQSVLVAYRPYTFQP